MYHKILFKFFSIINSHYFQAVQAAVFYEKKASQIFMSNLFLFLGLLVSFDKTKQKIKVIKNLPLKVASEIQED